MKLVTLAGHQVTYETDHGDYTRWRFNGAEYATRAEYETAVKEFQSFMASLNADIVVVSPLHTTRIPFPDGW